MLEPKNTLEYNQIIDAMDILVIKNRNKYCTFRTIARWCCENMPHFVFALGVDAEDIDDIASEKSSAQWLGEMICHQCEKVIGITELGDSYLNYEFVW